MKTISFAVPCYNSADYMDKCIESLLPCGEDIEIILVDDGSTKDNTAEIADEYAKKHPGVVKVVHKSNGGHGSAVNAGLDEATGLYFKVVDSDDWLDVEAMKNVMSYLRTQKERVEAGKNGETEASIVPADLVITNYVYEKVFEDTRTVIRYANVFPINKEFTWSDIGHFHNSQYLLMHSVIYRTQLLRQINLRLPEHCFYVDNIYVYVPLPHVSSIMYLDVDAYRYFIGREDQSVNEKVMLARIDQQIRVTKTMIDSVDLEAIQNKKLQSYMKSYLGMMMCICSIFLRMEPTPENDAKREDIWRYLKSHDEDLYRSLRKTLLNVWANLPTKAGRKFGLSVYHVAQKIFKFN